MKIDENLDTPHATLKIYALKNTVFKTHSRATTIHTENSRERLSWTLDIDENAKNGRLDHSGWVDNSRACRRLKFHRTWSEIAVQTREAKLDFWNCKNPTRGRLCGDRNLTIRKAPDPRRKYMSQCVRTQLLCARTQTVYTTRKRKEIDAEPIAAIHATMVS